MIEFDDIESLNNPSEKKEKLINFYIEHVKVDNWLTNNTKNSIITFKDRREYKKNDKYHRLNGPAIDYDNSELDIYYYNGEKIKSKGEWEKISQKETRRIKIKKLKINTENEKSSD